MARYKVTKEPGSPVEGLGYVKAGEAFIAPSGYVPHTPSFIPLDEEALQALKSRFPSRAFVIGETSPPEKKESGEETSSSTAERYSSRPPPKRV